MSESRYPALLHIEEDGHGRVTIRLEPDGHDGQRPLDGFEDMARTAWDAPLRVDVVAHFSRDYESNFTDLDLVTIEPRTRPAPTPTPPSASVQQVVVCSCGRVGRIAAALHWEERSPRDDVPF